tara:strand:+ start:474 stop:1061 length:588 start_codon:yes stop_codon:yes gene_type:complete
MKQLKITFLSIVLIVAVGILLLMVFYFENRLEENSYKLLRNSLFIGIPVVIIGYIFYEKLFSSIRESILNSSFFIRTYKESQQQVKKESFIFDYMNGKCFHCKKNKLSPIVDEKVKAGTLLKCLECQSINKKTIPDKLAMSPLFLAGGSIFLFEIFNDYERQIMLGSLAFSFVIGIMLARFWVNQKFTSDKEPND